ncbi:MAG: LAO/AO transport system kinase [Psychromonas sp.]|jgi:LAO/AO transport system kinase
MNELHKENWKAKRREHSRLMRSDVLFDALISGDNSALSSAITLLESSLQKDQITAQALIKKSLPFAGKSIRIGVTGVPGVGKSTFIESFGMHLIAKGKKIAVLAIDPSSKENSGSILGDKTRMSNLSVSDNAFIRPSPAGVSLGGVARKTRECIVLCEAAGYDVILVETVGVGQSETLVHSMVDFFLLLMLAGAGDELQGIKRGIMELADLLIINKADGDNVKKAQMAAQEYKNAMHLFPANENNWIPQAKIVSALHNHNIQEVWEEIEKYQRHTNTNGSFDQKRREQEIQWFIESLKDNILNHFTNDEVVKLDIEAKKVKINNKEISAFEAADQWMKKWILKK